MLRFALTVLALMPFCVPANAQTAEETVAYILHGLEDGAKSDIGIFKQTGNSPAAYTSGGFKITVSKIIDCKYNINMRVGYTEIKRDIDMALIGSMTVENRNGTFVQRQPNAVVSCTRTEYGKPTACDPATFVIFAELGNSWPVRSKDAMQYFKANFCRGKAF